MESKEIKTESKSLHTKGHWTTYHYLHESSIYCADWKLGIAKMPYKDFPYSEEEVQANADHICKCVNAHDELIEALKKCISIMEAVELRGDAINFARQTLKKATL